MIEMLFRTKTSAKGQCLCPNLNDSKVYQKRFYDKVMCHRPKVILNGKADDVDQTYTENQD